MAMDQELAALYNTPGSASAEDQEKVASVELFSKLASENGVDLNELSDDQVAELWDATMGTKVAEAEEVPAEETVEDEQAKVAAAAQAEFAATQEWQEKVAESDKLGRIMAHSYVQELNKIAEAQKEGGEMPPQFAKKDEGDKEDKEDKEEAKDEGDKDSDKEASAIDQLAARHAVELAKKAGVDEELATRKVAAVIELNLCAPSEKIASATSVEETVHIRALEHLEAAGFPVTWQGE